MIYPDKNSKAKQFGTVLVFKQGLTKEEIEARLRQIADIVDEDYRQTTVHSFNPDWGGPVWYVP